MAMDNRSKIETHYHNQFQIAMTAQVLSTFNVVHTGVGLAEFGDTFRDLNDTVSVQCVKSIGQCSGALPVMLLANSS